MVAGAFRRLPPAAPDGRGGRLLAGRVPSHLKVYHNVVAAFSVWYVSLFYILAMAALCLHLDHGVWSMFQTLGLNNAGMSPGLRIASRVVATRGVRGLYLGAGGRVGRLGIG